MKTFAFIAVPSVRLSWKNHITERSIRARKKESMQEVQHLIEEHSLIQPREANVPLDPIPVDNTVSVLSVELEDKVACLQSDLAIRNQQIEELTCKNENLEKRIEALERLNEDLKDVHNHQVLQKAKTLLATKYTSNQIDIMTGRKKHVIWSPEELAKGFTLKYLSKPALEYVIGTLQFPLPSVSCLESHASNIEMHKGFFNEVLQLLKAASATRSEKERVCVLMYDEMSVSEVYEFDRKNDVVIGPYNKMQVYYY